MKCTYCKEEMWEEGHDFCCDNCGATLNLNTGDYTPPIEELIVKEHDPVIDSIRRSIFEAIVTFSLGVAILIVVNILTK